MPNKSDEDLQNVPDEQMIQGLVFILFEMQFNETMFENFKKIDSSVERYKEFLRQANKAAVVFDKQVKKRKANKSTTSTPS